jgi:ABC-type transport system involved in multi-copper enzyme maturation permease subunit
MFWHAFLSQQSKILRQKLLWIELAGMAAIIALLSTLPYIEDGARGISGETMSLTADMTMLVKFSGGAAFGGLLMVILAGAAMGGEYGWHGVHQWLSRGVSRPAFLWGKFASLLVPLALIPLTALAVGGPLMAIFINMKQGGLGPIADGLPDLLTSIPVSMYTMLPYIALAVLLAILGKSTVTAIGGGIAFMVVVESILGQLLPLLGGWWAEIPGYLPSRMAASLLEMESEGAAVLLPQYQAALGLAVWTIALLALATWVFQRQDLSE